MGLFAKQDVQDGFGTCKLFAEVHADAPVSGDSVFGVEGNGVNAKVYATDLDPDILTGLSDGTISAANGAHWINVYFAAALLANAVNGNVLKDADGNAPRLVVPVMTLPSSYIELYNRLWIENAPFTEEELAALVGPDVTLETLQAQLDNYTIDQRLDALVAAGRVTQEEVDAARSAAE